MSSIPLPQTQMCSPNYDVPEEKRFIAQVAYDDSYDHFAPYMIIDNIKHIGVGNLILVWVQAYAST